MDELFKLAETTAGFLRLVRPAVPASSLRDGEVVTVSGCEPTIPDGRYVVRAESPADDCLRDAVIAAYIAGATDVHENRRDDRAPDFTEAAHDYATHVLRAANQPAAHASDCAVNNGPALPVGPCDCKPLTVPASEGLPARLKIPPGYLCTDCGNEYTHDATCGFIQGTAVQPATAPASDRLATATHLIERYVWIMGGKQPCDCKLCAEAREFLAGAAVQPAAAPCGCSHWTNGLGESGVRLCETHFKEARAANTTEARHD